MTAVVTPVVLRDAIGEALWEHVRAQDLAEVCIYLGLAPQGENEDPFRSKRGYVRPRLLATSMDELAEVAQKVVAQLGAPELAAVLARLAAHGVVGDLKNLIFAADGPKPRIVLRDAISNVIEIVDNAESASCMTGRLPSTGWQGASSSSGGGISPIARRR